MPLRDFIGDLVDEGEDRTRDFGSDIESAGSNLWNAGSSVANLPSNVPTSTSDVQSGASTAFSGIGTGITGSADFVVDNPLVSLQDDIVQPAMTQSFRAGQVVGGHDPDGDIDDVSRAFGDATSDIRSGIAGTIDDTPADNVVTDTVGTVGDAFVAQPARSLTGMVTGVDVGSGDADFDPSALQVVEGVALGAGGVAARSAGGLSRAARSSSPGTSVTRTADDGTSGLRNIFSRSGDEVPSAGRFGDDVGDLPRVADDATDSARTPDSIIDTDGTAFSLRGGPGPSVRSGDDAGSIAARVGDDATEGAIRTAGEITQPALPRQISRIGDDTTAGAGRAVTRSGDDAGSAASRVSDDTVDGVSRSPFSSGRSGDDAASGVGRSVSRSGDDAASGVSRVGSRSGDDAASGVGRIGSRSADDTGSAVGRTAARSADDAEDAGGLLSRFSSSRAVFGVSGRTAGLGLAATGGALVGGIAATALLSPDEIPDEFDAEMNGIAYTFQLVERLPATDEHPQGAELYAVMEGGVNTAGFWVVLGADPEAGDVYVLDEAGNERTANVTSDELLQGAVETEEEG